MTKRNHCLAIVLLLLSCSISWAEVKIEETCRITNTPDGRCGWCAIETLARHHRIKVLYDLHEKYSGRSSVDSLKQCLKDTGTSYRIQYAGTHDQSILKEAVRQELGAAVGFRELRPGAGGHIVTLVEFTENTVKVIDSNDQDRRTRTMSLDRFLYWWDGFALVLEAKPDSKRLLTSVKGE